MKKKLDEEDGNKNIKATDENDRKAFDEKVNEYNSFLAGKTQTVYNGSY